MRRLAVFSLLCLMMAIPADAAASLPVALSRGTFCAHTAGGQGSLLVFGGWRSRPQWVWSWLAGLQQAAFSGKPLALRCAIQGPQDASYRQPEFDMPALARYLLQQAGNTNQPVTLVAHSSGSFVAHSLLRALRELGGVHYLARIRYYNLDGDIGEGEVALDKPLIDTLASVTAVYAHDARHRGDSANADAMRALERLGAGKVRLVALDAAQSGCEPGAIWCLHDVLVNRRPYDPRGFDLARDYGRINATHPVQAGYLVATSPAGEPGRTFGAAAD